MRRAVTPRFRDRVRWLPSVALFVFLMGVAIFATRSAYAPLDLLLLGALYASLAVAMSSAARLLARRGTGLELVGTLFIGLVAAWHLRE